MPSVLVRGGIAPSSVGDLDKIDGILNAENYCQITVTNTHTHTHTTHGHGFAFLDP